MNFDSVDDMYALAVRAADSADAVANYNGYMALTACRVHDRSRLEALLAAAVASPQDKERARAASLVLHRCAGVFNNDASAIAELQQRLLAVVRRTPGFFTTARPPGKPTADEFQLAAQRGDWVTLQNIIDRRSLQMQTSEAAASQAVNEAALLAFLRRATWGATAAPTALSTPHFACSATVAKARRKRRFGSTCHLPNGRASRCCGRKSWLRCAAVMPGISGFVLDQFPSQRRQASA